jgi:hypothetical protein
MTFQNFTQCNATSKSTGERCKCPAVSGSTKCRLHGGKSLKGVAHPNYQGKGFSSYLPDRLVKIYDDVEADNEHTLLSRNIKLREVLIRETLAKLDDSPESAEIWQTLRRLWDDLRVAFTSENYGKVELVMRQVDRLIDERVLYFAALDQIQTGLAEQRKDKQAIAAIEFKGENAVPATELMVLMGAVLKIIQTVVTDKQQRIQIADGIDSLFSKQTSVIETHE